MARVRVGEPRDLAPGEGKVVEAGGKALALFNVDGTFYALDNACRHRGGPLGEGELDGAVVICPWHGYRWDVSTGVNTQNSALTVGCYPVSIDAGGLFVEV